MNFISTFEELNKLYEEVDPKQEKAAEDIENAKQLNEATDEGAEDEVPVEEAPVEEPIEEAEPRQIVIECDKCGALIVKNEADIVVDEKSDLVNVEDACAFCEETAGYKIIGVLLPYEPTEEVPAETVEEKEVDEVDEPIEESYYACAEIDGEERRFPFNDREAARKYISDIRSGNLPEFKGKKIGSVWTEGFNAEEAAEDNLMDEDLADWYRKKFDKPASVTTQQAWEDELNGEMGEISDKRRKHLERKFKQQRDWEARHAEKKDAEELEELLDFDVDVPVNISANGNEVAVGGATV